MTVTERKEPHTTAVVLDADGDVFVAAIGYARNQRLTRHQGHGGTSEHVHDLAHLIADTLLHRPRHTPAKSRHSQRTTQPDKSLPPSVPFV
ncbi:MAG: hypothetical protein ACRDZ4_19300 [Egibacteraceae bacterium]